MRRLVARAIAFAERHPWRWFLAYTIATVALYQLAIRAPLYAPFVVAPTAIDDAIPLVGWTAAPYLTYFALMPIFVALACRSPGSSQSRRGRALVAAGLVVLGNLALNIVVPTTLAHPLDPDAAARAGWLLGQVVAGDTPRAALPSGHVALPLALWILGIRARLRGAWIFAPWTAILAIVILTTKQHYFPDALGGLAWGALGATLAWRATREVAAAT